MWKVHVVDLGKLFLFKIFRVVKFLIQNHAFYKNVFI